MESTSRARITQMAQGCACLNLRRTARSLTHFYDAKMAAAGLRVTQCPLLVVLYLAGPSTIQEMAENLGLDRTTLTRNLKPLEQQGLVTSTPGTDLRTRVVTLTPTGERTLLDVLPLWEEAQNQVVNRLGAERFASLLDDLQRTSASTHPG